MGENPLRSLPQSERVRNALSNLDFLVVQDILRTETSEFADVVLPGAAFDEKGGAFTNFEGRIQSFEPAVSPPGEAKPDWEILDLLYERMASSAGYSSLVKIRQEIRQLVPMYEQLGRNGGVSWLKNTSGMSLYHPGGKGDAIRFFPVSPAENGKSDDDYYLNAILGSQRYHLGSGTRTGYSSRIREFDLKGEVEISPEDGSALSLKDGDTVKVSSPRGYVERQVKINSDLISGIIFIPLAFHGNNAMELIELNQLGKEGSPGIKGCRVKIEKQ
jgi:predicted molibdopterin-dependent oxidoreductase YjgC